MTTDTRRRISELGGGRPPLIGMVHLRALPGSPGWRGSMRDVLERAVADARALEAAGFDAVIVENFMDAPFFKTAVPPETVAGITSAAAAVRAATGLPLGVNVLRNDARSALGIAAVVGADFIRVNVHTGSMWTDQGLVEGQAAETLRLRSSLAPHVGLVADVHVKHATPIEGDDLLDAARDCWFRGLADALVVSGSGTGHGTDLAEVSAVREAVPEACVWIGSGLTAGTAREALALADGAIVGTSVMNGGRPGAGIDPGRAVALVQAVRGD